MKSAEEFVSFSQGNVKALVKSSQIVAAGLQDLGKMIAISAQTATSDAMSTFRTLTSIRSLVETFDLQAALARSTIEKSLMQTSQIGESSFKLVEQARAPITSRISLADEAWDGPGYRPGPFFVQRSTSPGEYPGRARLSLFSGRRVPICS